MTIMSVVLKSKLTITKWAGELLNSFGVPGFVKNIEITDAATNMRLRVKTGEYFTVLSINGRDFYFWRLTGTLDGTGTCLTQSVHPKR